MSGFAPFGSTPLGAGVADSSVISIPVTSYALSTLAPQFPVQPGAVSLSLATSLPALENTPLPLSSMVLEAIAPEVGDAIRVPTALFAVTSFDPLADVIHLPLSIEFRHAPLIPWVMPMTSPVYPPSTTFLLEHPLPDVSIHGFWSPHAMLFGWEYDENTDTISIPISTLFELTAGQADSTNGDWRAVVLALVNSMWDSYVELDSPPQAMVLDYSPGYMMQTGPFAGYVKAEYVTTAYLNFPEKTLADEP